MGIGVQHIGAQGGQIFQQAIQDRDGFPHPARDEVTKEGDICITNVMVGLYLLYAPPLRHVTSCCINRFQAASRIGMPFCGSPSDRRA